MARVASDDAREELELLHTHELARRLAEADPKVDGEGDPTTSYYHLPRPELIELNVEAEK